MLQTAIPHFRWQRFWCPRAGGYSLSDGGYLLDPINQNSLSTKSDAVPFESFQLVQCLILLGEPGIGKSDVMFQLRETKSPEATATPPDQIWLDLKNYGSETRIAEKLRHHQQFQIWSTGNGTLSLFLDSLDECMLHVPVVARLIVEELANHSKHAARLKVRIACRTADWPSEIEKELSSIWQTESAVQAYELVPLRRIDVVAAAKGYDVDPDKFQIELTRANAIPFAIKPITLHLLLRIFRKNGTLPTNQADIYRIGCRQLCEEPIRHRREKVDQVSADRRMDVAGRIAAVTTFCNRVVIYRGTGIPDDRDVLIGVSELSGGQEGEAAHQFPVDESTIIETLATGLFSARGPDRFGWAHQTYSKFLAAQYLRSRAVPTVQILGLIGRNTDVGWRVVPQLQEAAAWLSNELPEIREHLIRHDPTVLLRSDVAGADDKTRHELTASLLALVDRGELIDWRLMFGGNYRKLVHPGLVDQLRAYITDKTKSWDIRRFAIDVVRQGELHPLVPALILVALDASDDLSVRKDAAFSVNDFGNGNEKRALLPLARGEAGDDPDDELKGAGLSAVWPDHLTAKEVFSLITFPKKLNLFGQYRSFLTRDLIERLPLEGLADALGWVCGLQYPHVAADPITEIADSVIAMAWDAGAAEGSLLPIFTDAILSRFRQHGPIVRPRRMMQSDPLWDQDDPRRRILLQEAVNRGESPEVPFGHLYYTKPPLAIPSDIPWMINQIQHPANAEQSNIWVQLICSGFAQNYAHVEDILDAMDVPSIKASLGPFFEPFLLDSPDSNERRAKWAEHKELRGRAEPPLLDPPPHVRLENALAECEAENPDRWMNVVLSLTLVPRQWDHIHDGNQADIRTLPGWVAASAETRLRIMAAAKNHLANGKLDAEKLLEESRFTYSAIATYRALILLTNEEPTWLAGSPKQQWYRWSPFIVGHQSMADANGKSSKKDLFAAAYGANPDYVIALVIQLAEGENGTHGYHLYSLKQCWDDRVASAMLAKVSQPSTPLVLVHDLLEHLMEHRDAMAIAIAVCEVDQPLPTDPDALNRFSVFANLLMQFAPGAGWPAIWAAMTSNDEWAKTFISHLASRLDRHGQRLGVDLTEVALGDLYEWLLDRFPPKNDPEDNSFNMHRITDIESIASFRDGILGRLQNRGTPAAVDVLSAIAARRPTMRHLRWAHQIGRQEMLRQTWEPPQPQHLLALMRDPRSRIIQDADHLVELVIESLRRWEAILQGTPPAAYRLWDKNRPKEEEKLSDEIALHLREDLARLGLIANREVVIRKGEKPGGKGERTDVLVQAVRPPIDGRPMDVITVTIEVKGCWNAGLMTDIRDQLCDRYLRDNDCRHGIYLVGWYVCPQWDSADSRWKATSKLDRDLVTAQLETVAKDLSQSGVHVRSIVLRTGLR